MAEQDVQGGAGVFMGIPGAITFTPTGGSDLGGGMNFSSITKTANWTLDELANSGGTYIESSVATKAYRDLEINFIAKGTTRANAETVLDSFEALTPNQVITIAAGTATIINIAGNLLSGLRHGLNREGRAEITCSIRQYQGSGGTYGALAAITG